MTTQSKEILEYRGKQYLIEQEPLKNFIENHNEIKFEAYSSGNSRDYQGYWLLKNEKLFFKNIHSANYSFNDLFKEDKPVLAEWYSGFIEFGIGEEFFNSHEKLYENYVKLKIENGVVTEKCIYKIFRKEQAIEFGKYKGRNLSEILKGKFESSYYSTIINYVEDVLSFLTNKEFGFNIQIPILSINNEEKKLIEEIRNYGLRYFVTRNYVAIDATEAFLEDNFENSAIERFSIFLEKILSGDFTNMMKLTKEENEIADISENTILVNSDIEYLKWALMNVDFFCLPPTLIDDSNKFLSLKSFKTNRLNSLIFEYKPIVESQNYKIADDIIKLNETYMTIF